MDTNIDIFCSYSHKDQVFLDELRLHLSPLQRQGLISLWNDSDITPGTQWEDEIDKQLRKAQIILLLISPDFMASDYCYSVQLKQAIERHQRKEVRVIPIILRPTHWEVEPLKKLLALPKNAVPITLWENRDAAFLDVVQGISRAINELATLSAIRPLALPEQSRIRRAPLPYSQVEEEDLPAEDMQVFPNRPVRRVAASREAHPIIPQRRKPLPAPRRYSLLREVYEDELPFNDDNIGWTKKLGGIFLNNQYKVTISTALVSIVIALILFFQENPNIVVISLLLTLGLLLLICSLVVYLYSIIKDFILSKFGNHQDEDEYED